LSLEIIRNAEKIPLEEVSFGRKNCSAQVQQFVKLHGEPDILETGFHGPVEIPEALFDAPGRIGLRLEEERNPGGKFFAQPFDRPEA
jgi:hypothetical protein